MIGPQHMGLWHDPRYPAQGFPLLVGEDGRLTLYHYGQNVDTFPEFLPNEERIDDAPRYWFGTSTDGWFNWRMTIDPRSDVAKAHYPDARLHQEVAAGPIPAHLGTFGDRLKFDAFTFEHGRISQVLEPIALSADPRNGTYCLPGAKNAGWTILFIPPGPGIPAPVCVAHWFGQRKRPAFGQRLYNSKQCQTNDWTLWTGTGAQGIHLMREKRIRHSCFQKPGELRVIDHEKDGIPVGQHDPNDPRAQEYRTGNEANLVVDGDGVHWGGVTLERVA